MSSYLVNKDLETYLAGITQPPNLPMQPILSHAVSITGSICRSTQCTEVRFASFLSGGFITAIVVNPPERKVTKRTSVQWRENP